MAFDRAKFLARFIEEARDHIARLNDGLLVLEKSPEDETLNSVFRSAHTIKGASRMMKLTAISEVAHKLEDALDALRQKKLVHSKALSDLFFRGVDCISGMVERVASGEDVTEVCEALCEELEAAAEGKKTAGVKQKKKADTPLKKTETPVSPAAQQVQALPDAVIEPDREAAKEKQLKIKETVRISEEKLDEMIKLMGEIVSSHSRLRRRMYEIREIEKKSNMVMNLISAFEAGQDVSGESNEKMIQTSNALCRAIKKYTVAVKEDANIQELLTAELQDRSLKMRMLPLSTIFNNFHRTVRDMSRDFGKEIDFLVEGGDTELDKKIIEKLGDPLIHMIRNCVDHAIETPGERVKAGKPETGTIRLSASYEGGNVLIELSDDGAGISVKKIKEKAVKKKMLDEADLKNIPDSEIINLIFHPGLSTSDIITDISGRGVGMDVVQKNICEDLKGTIQIETKEGKGTAFYIRLPLTMAVMHVLVISVSDMVFAIPSNYINEILRVAEADFIDVVDKKAIRLREQIIPVIGLNDVLGLPAREEKGEIGLLVIVVSVGGEHLGLIVDSLLKEEHRTIKPLPVHLKNIQWVSGVTISGKNELDNVLHIPKIIEASKEIRIEDSIKRQTKTSKKQIHILVADDSISTREIEKSILESYGYNVTLASDGVEALESTKNFKYDLVVTDIEMPRLDGFSLTQKLKNNKDYKDTPVILVSSRDKEEDKKRGLQVGADAYIIKGDFDQTNLLETIQNLVG